MYNPIGEILTFWETIIFIFGLISSYFVFGYQIKAVLYLKYWPNELLKLKIKKELRFIEDLEA